MKYPFLKISILLVVLASACSPKQKPTTKANVNKSAALEAKQLEEADFLFFTGQKEKLIGNTDKAESIFAEVVLKNPKNDAAFYELARLSFEQGKANRALLFIEQAVKQSPENIWYLLLEAELYARTNQSKKAIESLKKALQYEKKYEELYLQLAQQQIASKLWPDALSTLRTLEQNLGISPESTDLKMMVLKSKGENKKVVVELQKAVAEHPNDPAYLYQLAIAQIELKEYQDAAVNFKKVVQLSPEFGEAWYNLFVCYIELNNKQEAKVLLEEMALNPDLDLDVKLKFFSPIIFLSAEEIVFKPDGLALAKKLVETHPNDFRAYSLLADFYLDMGYQSDALKAIKKALSFEESKNIYAIWQQYLLMLFNMQEYDLVVENANNALSYFPSQPLLYYLKGVSQIQKEALLEGIKTLESGLFFVGSNRELESDFYSSQGDAYHKLANHEASDNAYEQSLSANPNNALVLNNYSYYLSQRGKNLEKALKMSALSNKLELKNPSYLDTYGWILFKMNRYEEAKKYIAEALLLDESNPTLLDHMGDVLFKLNQINQAVEYWQRALQFDANNPKIQQKINAKHLNDD